MRIHQLFFAKAPEAAARSLEALWMKGHVSEGLQGTCIILVEVRGVGSQNSFTEDVGSALQKQQPCTAAGSGKVWGRSGWLGSPESQEGWHL